MTKSDSKLDLHEALSRGSFEHALLCTFTFDPTFFEEYCLEKFKSLNSNGNITVVVDRRTYERLLLGTESQRPTKANLRYLLQPVSAPGAFHSKIYLLASRKKGRLIIGSANLTRTGITSNAEMVASFEYEEDKNQTFRTLFQATFQYFSEVSRRSPTEAFNSNLSALAREVPWLVAEGTSSDQVPAFLHNLDEPIWPRLCAEIVAPVDTVYVLSRYFDPYPSLLDEIDTSLSPQKIKIFSQNGITNMTPDWLSHRLVKTKRAEIFLCRFSDADHAQPLHAKAMIFEKGGRCLLVFGSANFTSAALLRTIKNGNAEAVLSLKDLPSTMLKPARLFDPDGTAVLLKEPKMLQRTDEEDQPETTEHAMRLYEASLKDDVIVITADIPETIDRETLFATLTFQRFANRSLKVRLDETGSFSVKVSEVEKQRLDSESTTIQLEVLEDGESIDSSNCLLVTNLKDLRTDRPLRRERHLKEAEESAAQFFAVLRELLQTDDEEALLTFLNFCDIPLVGVARPALFRRMKPVWDGGAGMKPLGARNLAIYKDLHEASLSFFDRHFRKLRRHADALTLEGVANFLHIFLAMGGILRAQIERSVIGLESNGSAATAEQWAECRKHWDTYFDRFKQLMTCLGTEYLSPMIKEYGVNKVKEEFGPDLEPIHDLCSDMLNYRYRIEAFRTVKLRRVVSKREIIPGYFYSILGPAQWPRYAQEVGGVLDRVERSLGYAA